MPAWSPRRPLAVLLFAFAATVGVSLGVAGPALAAAPRFAVMLAATPHPADGNITYTGTVYVLQGSPTNVELGMAPFQGSFLGDSSCEPVASCHLTMHGPIWDFPTLTGTRIVTFTTPPMTTQTYITFGVVSISQGDVACYGVCPARLDVGFANVTSELTWSAAGQVVTGSTLHITARATTDSSWFHFANLHVDLPAGVDAPTNLPADATYWPPAHYIDRPASFEPTSSYSFDVVVNAASGSILTFHASGGPAPSMVIHDATLSIKVGQDHTAPTATAPTRSLVAGHALSGGRIPVMVRWTGSDSQTGVDGYTLAQSTDGGAWTTVATGLHAPSSERLLSSGHAYRFRVRATDHVGNVGSWAYGSDVLAFERKRDELDTPLRGDLGAPLIQRI